MRASLPVVSVEVTVEERELATAAKIPGHAGLPAGRMQSAHRLSMAIAVNTKLQALD